ncbi:MAG: hypothetical protein CL878_14105, partial [Dehalococcoidia bacterium]|nr:hypothetical protein [Dehalococcoidia bacterium]
MGVLQGHDHRNQCWRSSHAQRRGLLLGGAALIAGCAPSFLGRSPSEDGQPSSQIADAASSVSSQPTKTAEIIPDVPRDAIPPLDLPAYDLASDVRWLRPSDLVVGFVWKHDARAYPARLMNFHEIVNDQIAGRDVVVTYCPLCRSGIAFDRWLPAEAAPDGEPLLLSFGNTGALYESAMVMYDRETDSDWYQVGGVAVRGPLAGSRLKALSSRTTTWQEWR